jgi:transcriptional regulator with XRE-family HTH domain
MTYRVTSGVICGECQAEEIDILSPLTRSRIVTAAAISSAMTRLPYGETPSDVSTRLRQVRKEKRLTLEEVAARIGTTRQTVQRWEVDGRALTVKRLHDLAHALEVPVRYLLPGDDGLTEDEREMVAWMRQASAGERRALDGVRQSLSDTRREAFETRKPR